MRFIPLNFTNLSHIQLGISELIKMPNYTDAKLFYPENHVNLFLTVDPLREELEKLKLLDDVLAIAVIVVDPGQRIPIHTDTGGYTYSLNIPISGYNKTYVNFYKPESESHSRVPVVRSTGESTGHTYNKFDIQTCELIDSFESTMPYIMDTQVPHDVVNKSRLPRVFLLIRLKSHANELVESMFNSTWKSYGESNPACLDENQMS